MKKFLTCILLICTCVIFYSQTKNNTHAEENTRKHRANVEDVHATIKQQADTVLKYEYVFKTDTVYVYQNL